MRIVAWRAVWHIADDFGSDERGWPFLTKCGVEIPDRSQGQSHMDVEVDGRDDICKRCAKVTS